jgi:L-ascorbate metabolism protein UlaG (beta-lactamase superfamily)
VRVTYVGHATLLLRVGGAAVLTDPNFDPALGPFALGSRLRRVAPPGVALAALPPLALVLVTHAHVDHLSLASLRALCAGPDAPPVVAPPTVARWLRAKGFATAAPLAAGAHVRVGPVAVHAAPAAHVGARWGAFDRWRGRDEAHMYLVDGGDEGTAFFAGDTALTPDTHRLADDVLHATGRQLDLALLPIGHAPAWKRDRFRAGHLTAGDALALFARLGARWMVPYHWGTFTHVTSGAFEAMAELRRLLRDHAAAPRVRVLEPGQSFEVLAAAPASTTPAGGPAPDAPASHAPVPGPPRPSAGRAPGR